MKTRLEQVGDHPPRTMRGKMLIPAALIPPTWRWGGRLLLVVAMVVAAPAALPVVGWWFWGLRRRRWVWPHAAVGLASTLVVPFLVPGAGTSGVGLWLYLAGVDHHLTRLDPLGLIAMGWIVGTWVGCWVSFLSWMHTPPLKDGPRPKTWRAALRERHLHRLLSAGEGDVTGVVTFGTDTDTGQPVELEWDALGGHALVVGSPGSGKSTSAMRVVRAAIRDGLPTYVVDMKAEPDLIDEIAAWCARWGRPLWVFSQTGPTRYDPFTHGDYNRKRDLLMATAQWSNEHYKGVAADYLLAVFYLLDIIGTKGRSVLEAVNEYLNPEMLARAVATLPAADPRTPVAKERCAAVIEAVRTDPRSLGGLGPKVRALTDTVLGQWTKPGEPMLDPRQVWDEGGVAVWSLPTLDLPESSTVMGGLVVQDLKTMAGHLQAQGNTQPGLVFVDEFATLGAHNIVEALALARASGLRWMVATQDLGDLRVGEDGAAFEQKILTDTNVKIIHSVGDPVTAERLAALAGTKWAIKERTSVNVQDASLMPEPTGTATGKGMYETTKVPALEPNNVLHQGLGEDGTFTLVDKAGGYLITGAHTVPDESTFDGQPTAPQYLPDPAASPHGAEHADAWW